MNIALCKCGIDMTEHPDLDVYDQYDEQALPVDPFDHVFDAAGTKYRCEKIINTEEGAYLCPRPAYHAEESLPCGPLTGTRLWV